MPGIRPCFIIIFSVLQSCYPQTIESTERCQESGIAAGSVAAFQRHPGSESSMILATTNTTAPAATKASGGVDGGDDKGGGGTEGGCLGLTSRTVEWMRVMVRVAASASCVASAEVTRDQALRFLACLIPGLVPPRGEGME